MNIEEMEENGIYDYFDVLDRWINHFVDRNYPLSKEDITALCNGTTTENIINRNKVLDILHNEMEIQLSKIQDMNTQIINGMENGTYTPYSIESFNKHIEQMQQEMLEKLWNEQHPQEQNQSEQSDTIEEANSETQNNSEIEEHNDWEQRNEEIYDEQTGEQNDEQNGEQMLEQVIEQSQEIEIRSEEISELNREINQEELNYVQEQQMPPSVDMDMGIGE